MFGSFTETADRKRTSYLLEYSNAILYKVKSKVDNLNNRIVVYDSSLIQRKIFTLRGRQVMIDSDLAKMYGVETRRLNEQVKRNIERFPKEFMFQLTKEEDADLMSQIATSNKQNLKSQNAISSYKHGGRRKFPNVLPNRAWQCCPVF